MRPGTPWRIWSVLLLSGAAVLQSCGGADNGSGAGPDQLSTNPSRCPTTGLLSLPGACCDTSGSRTSFTGPCAGPELAGVPPMNGAQTFGAAAGNSAALSNTAASKLAGLSPATLPATSAATAGGLQSMDGIARARPAAALVLPNPGVKTGPAPSAPGTGVNSGAPASGGGGTAPADLSGAALTVHAPVGDGGAIYGSGGGGAAAGGASGSNTANSRVVAAGSQSQQEFGDPTAARAMSSEDPDDYFTRVGLSDSIFKIVEKRYRSKAMGWSLK